jgi:hypothetical protein
MEIVTEWRAHVSAHYALLAQIPMPGDAANLHVPDRDSVNEALRAAWAAAGRGVRLRAQIEPLWYDAVEDYLRASEAALLDRLASPRPDSETLASRLREGVRALIDKQNMQAVLGPDPLPQSTHRWLVDTRSALYERSSEAPTLRIIHTPALGYTWRGVRFTRGRATENKAGERIIAVSIDADPEQLAIQLLHEETHPITDPAVFARHKGVARRTDGKGEGGALHMELEQLVVDVDAAVIEARAPELSEAYAVWRSQFGM